MHVLHIFTCDGATLSGERWQAFGKGKSAQAIKQH